MKVVDEPVTVVVSLKGWARALKGHEVDPASQVFKAGDGLYGSFPVRSVDSLLAFGSNGRVYTVPVASLPGGRGDGAPVTTLIDVEPGTQCVHYVAGAADHTLLLANTGGFGLLAKLGDMLSRQRGGRAFLTVDAGQHLLLPAPVLPQHKQVATLSLSGRLLVFPLDELKLQPNGGRGLTLMDVDEKDPLLSAASFADALLVRAAAAAARPRPKS